jgi:hypothetical protein
MSCRHQLGSSIGCRTPQRRAHTTTTNLDDGSSSLSVGDSPSAMNHVAWTRATTARLRGGAASDILLDGAAASTASTLAEAAILTAADYGSIIEGASNWLNNLGAPSALVAGAVVATLYENIHSGDLVASETDGYWVQVGKKVTHLLLLSAFALEVVAIFVTTVTGTMLLSARPDVIHPTVESLSSPLEFLRENYEFEYLTARISFSQGLLNWLAAIALTHVLPAPQSPDEDSTHHASVVAFNKFVALSIMTVIVVMLSFYNNHMTFYKNYLDMLGRYVHITIQIYFRVIGGPQTWPPRPLGLILSPLFALTLYYGYRALTLYERPAPAPAKHKPEPERKNKTPGLFSRLEG